MTKKNGKPLVSEEPNEKPEWATLGKQYAAAPLASDEFTCHTMAAELELSFNQTQRVINAMIADGKVEAIGRRRIDRGRPENAYRMTRHEK